MLDNASDLVFGPVFDSVDIGLVVLDRGCIIGWNDWLARVSRRPVSDVLGKPFPTYFPRCANPPS